ncbi:hypothetical protein [Brevundimonas diminuta]|uniref:hypothetical protein n=1 Tax=Brevundimonas diminuta TaxID=293 RepID=UPI000B34F45F|nr:hypothetical protein [Brevundimonas diminuta]
MPDKAPQWRKFKQGARAGLFLPMLGGIFIGSVSGILNFGEAILTRSFPEGFWIVTLVTIVIFAISGLMWLIRRAIARNLRS